MNKGNITLKKKERSTNFTTEEMDLLMKCIFQEIHIIENKKTDAVTLKEKQEAWQRVTVLFNCANISNRDLTSVKVKYENIKRSLKKKMACAKMHQRGTGGGPPIDLKLLWFEEQLYSLLKINIVGLPAIGDSDAMNQNKIVYDISEMEPKEQHIGDHNSILDNSDISFIENNSGADEPTPLGSNNKNNENVHDLSQNIRDNITETALSSTTPKLTTNNRWNLKKRKRVTVSRTEKQQNIDHFINLAEKKIELVEIQKNCYTAELGEKQKVQLRQECEWETRSQILELELKIKKEEYEELLQENLRKKRLHELEEEKCKLELEILKCDLNNKLRAYKH